MSASQVIELNGRRYDAATGREVTRTQHQSPKKPSSQGVSLDGMAKRSHPPRKTSQPAHHRTQRSNTLKRSTVGKPQAVKNVASSKKAHQAKTPTKTMAEAGQALRHSVPSDRLHRVKSVNQSKLIQRFNSDVSPTVHKHAVKAKQHASSMVQAVSSVVDRPTAQFGQAIEQATSHTAKKIRKTPVRHRIARKLRISTKALNASAMAVAVLLFVGFFGYQNAPNLSMRVATMRSQVEGSLPGYAPNGFSLNRSIAYKPGEITLAYQSNSDERYFEVKQTASQWDSDALAQNFIAEKDQVRTIQDKGKTIYLYEESNATWVDGGVWYRIEGESLLNSDQLSRLANSL